MNNARRAKIEQAIALLDECMYDEQAAHDNLPEGLQDSDRTMAMDEAVNNLSDAIASAHEAQN